MMRCATIFVAIWLVIASFSNNALATDGVKKLGVGSSALTANGPTSVQVRLGGCQFSIALKKGEHIKYNDPDLIFYRADAPMPDRELPFLQQAQTYSGYDWWFKRRGTAHVPWIGFMCENNSDFKWSSNDVKSDASPELQDVMDENSLRCPADFVGRKWVPTSKSAKSFTELDVVGAQGFIVDEQKINKKEDGVDFRFCFVKGDNVLIGVSGGGWHEKNSENSSLPSVLRGIEFKSDVVPSKQ